MKHTQALNRAIEAVNSVGFSLIIGSIIYFIIGSVASLVGGKMLEWTFCGSVHRLGGPDWCGIEGSTGNAALNYFIHHLINAPIPWFMIFWGFVLTGICALLLKMLDHQYAPPGKKKAAIPE